MKNWKAVIAGLLFLCLSALMPFTVVFAEEESQEQETEDPIPESYYYPIESNEIQNWPQGPAIESASAVVMDMDTGTFLYSKQATEKRYPASITKIMTTLLLVENCDLDEKITFSGIVYDLEEGSSHLGIQPGEEMTLRDCAYGIMLASANDISNGVAEYMGGSLSGFADMMNEKAAALGCVNTHFSNPHGLFSEDHYTCAYDMALIAQAAYENPIFREIVETREYTIPETNLVEEERSFLNHHKMMQSDSEYYREWCLGGKTGFTSDSLNTLVTFAEKDGQRLVSVVLKVNGAGKAYEESTQILEYGFDNFYTENYEKKDSEKNFYDIMGLGYAGDAVLFQSSVWNRSPYKQISISLTLPNQADKSLVTYTVQEETGTKKTVSYEYCGHPVGTAAGDFAAVYAPAQLSFEKSIEIKETASEGDNIQIESLDEVLEQAENIFDSGYQIAVNYAKNNTMTVFIGGLILLVILVVFIILLIFRATADSRIRRRRKQEEVQRQKREEEIERMTTAEIEAELRAVMEQERLRREEEQRALAEAERAAEEARKIEEQAGETQRLLDELEQERQERLSKGINN